MVTLEITSGERLYIQHLLDSQTGSYEVLKKVWRLEEKLEMDPEILERIGWVEKLSNSRTSIGLQDENALLKFSLEDQDAKTLRDLFFQFQNWPKRPEVKLLGQKIEALDIKE